MLLGSRMADKESEPPHADDGAAVASATGGPRAALPARIASRLFGARWTLAAAVVALFGVAWSANASLWLAMAGTAGVALIAAFAPRRPAAERRAERVAAAGVAPVDGLSALRLSEAVADPLVLLDTAGVVVHANRPARDAFGIQQGLDLALRFRAPEMQAMLRDLLAGRPGTADYLERLPLERLHRVTATPVAGDSGLFVLVFKDQSEVRRIDRMRADFIANASHELRTPLASIAGFIETLRGPAKNDEAARERFLAIMQTQTSRMARLIDDLLSLSRLEMKAFVKPGETVDVVGVVGSVADALGHMAAEAAVAIELDLPPAPVLVPGSRDELTQVFENLLENAIKYGQSGKRVLVSLERGEAAGRPEIVVTVRDFGPGIPAEHIPRVTERFYRVDVESSRAQKGTGLGLAIVKHILTRHNARLAIRSTPGKGAAFSVHLPAS
jgi:two-component system phosphate regulon sensor histidine kinase PhoR